jgi:hypothetical protein
MQCRTPDELEALRPSLTDLIMRGANYMPVENKDEASSLFMFRLGGASPPQAGASLTEQVAASYDTVLYIQGASSNAP